MREQLIQRRVPTIIRRLNLCFPEASLGGRRKCARYAEIIGEDNTRIEAVCEDYLKTLSIYWIVRREDIELIGPELASSEASR